MKENNQTTTTTTKNSHETEEAITVRGKHCSVLLFYLSPFQQFLIAFAASFHVFRTLRGIGAAT